VVVSSHSIGSGLRVIARASTSSMRETGTMSRPLLMVSLISTRSLAFSSWISTDKDNGEETDPRTLAAIAWMLRRKGCLNINWVGGGVVILMLSIVDAIEFFGPDSTLPPAESALTSLSVSKTL